MSNIALNIRPTRRGILKAGAAAAASAFLPGCVSGGGSSLRFWNGFTGPDGRTILKLVQRFNRENPERYVTLQRMEWGTYYNKLFVAGIDGRAPETFVIHTSSAGRMRGGGILRPTDAMFSDAGGPIPADDFDPNVMAAVTAEGQRWAVPFDVHCVGMYYNKKLFREAGIVDDAGEPKPPAKREEFLDVCRRIRTLPDKPWGFAFTWLRNNCFTLMTQLGDPTLGLRDGRIADPSTLAGDGNVEALAFGRELIEQGLIPPLETMNSFIGFRQGRIAMILEGIYVLPELERQTDLEFGAAPTPQFGPRPGTFMNSHNLCLNPNLEGDTLDEAKAFLEFLSDNTLDWAVGGQIPARLSLQDTSRFREMTAQSTFATQVPTGAYPPQVPYIFEWETEFDLACEKALRAEATPADALRAAADRLEVAAARYEGFGGAA